MEVRQVSALGRHQRNQPFHQLARGQHQRRPALRHVGVPPVLAPRQHFIFADKPGGNSIAYRDLTKFGRLASGALVQEVRQEIGEVYWAVSLPHTPPPGAIEDEAKNYLRFVMERTKSQKPSKASGAGAVEVPELAPFISRFREDHPSGKRTAFIMMSFASTGEHKAVTAVVREVLKDHGIVGLRVDDKEYADDLFANIRTYMHCCDFGVSIFERILQDDFNPNVSLETGYMMGLGKPVCLLKDRTLKSLPSDLVGKLYKGFDPQNIAASVRPELEKWLKDKGLI